MQTQETNLEKKLQHSTKFSVQFSDLATVIACNINAWLTTNGTNIVACHIPRRHYIQSITNASLHLQLAWNDLQNLTRKHSVPLALGCGLQSVSGFESLDGGCYGGRAW
jgi:hypothetical protein